eukprot:514577_1
MKPTTQKPTTAATTSETETSTETQTQTTCKKCGTIQINRECKCDYFGPPTLLEINSQQNQNGKNSENDTQSILDDESTASINTIISNAISNAIESTTHRQATNNNNKISTENKLPFTPNKTDFIVILSSHGILKWAVVTAYHKIADPTNYIKLLPNLNITIRDFVYIYDINKFFKNPPKCTTNKLTNQLERYVDINNLDLKNNKMEYVIDEQGIFSINIQQYMENYPP